MKAADFRLFGILGFPLSHTLSPVMQEAALQSLGIKGFYLVLEQSEKNVKHLLKNLKQSSVEGFNVTVPYKEVVCKGLKNLTPEAKAIGAVNTIFQKRGKWVGGNTDAYGFLYSLKSEGKFLPRGKRALILGSGGSSKAVIYALARSGVKSITIANRTQSKVQALIRRFKKLFPKVVWGQIGLDKEDLKTAVRDADLVVNTTSVGLKPKDKALLSVTLIPKAGPRKKLFYDLIYNPAETKFLKTAKLRGHQTLNGAGMLAAQGAKSLECWTGKKAPLKLMYQTLLKALKTKG